MLACIFCGSVLSLVQSFFAFVSLITYIITIPKTQENTILTIDKIEGPQHIHVIIHHLFYWTLYVLNYVIKAIPQK